MNQPTTLESGLRASGRSGQSRRGFSLVEILVVVVVLVVGLLAIARLFPGGFATLGFSANATSASAQEKQLIDYLRNHQENLPAGIVALRDDSTAWSNGNPIWYDISVKQNLAPLPYVIQGFSGTQPDDPRFSDLNYFRHVVGERFMLAPPTSGAAGTGDTASLYRALFSPIYSDQAMFPGTLGVQAYSGTPMRRVTFEYPPSTQNWNDLQSLGDFGYGIDPSHGFLYLYSTTYNRQFKFDYTYHTTSAPTQAPPSNSLPVAGTGTAGQQVTIDLHQAAGSTYTPVPSGVAIDLNSDFLYHQFTQLPVATAFSANPFEFKVYDTVFGLFGFNPIAASLPLPEHQGRGQLVQVDYDVDDWHILKEDQSVPIDIVDTTQGTNGYHAIKLASGNVKKIGDTEDTINFVSGQSASTNSFQYQGLVRYYPDTPARTGTAGVDLVLVDLQTGFQIDSRTLQRDTNSTNGEIDYDKGIIHLRPIATFTSPVSGATAQFTTAGRQLRIYYRTYNDMGVAPWKPFDRYYRFAAIGPVTSQQYSDSYGAGYLLFPTCDTSGTVAVDYTYVLQQNGSGGPVTQSFSVVGETHQIQTADPCPLPGGIAGVGPDACSTGSQAWVRLNHASADPAKSGGDPAADPTVSPGTVVITGVRGVSLHSRAAWRDGNRWRQREHSTVLTRANSR